jgi:hypothetical protein
MIHITIRSKLYRPKGRPSLDVLDARPLAKELLILSVLEY